MSTPSVFATFLIDSFTTHFKVALSLATFAGCVYYFPVLVGRKILGAVVGNDRKVHEMYTV